MLPLQHRPLSRVLVLVHVQIAARPGQPAQANYEAQAQANYEFRPTTGIPILAISLRAVGSRLSSTVTRTGNGRTA
eukprot:scaffold472261_cov14-Prasinocladus_malaysianus.AAC.1